jgi:uncharacterized protein YndB with AHSA1/START domain
MKSILPSAAALFCSLSIAAHAASAIKDTSFRDADGHRVQQLELTVDAPPAKVWWALTTGEGFRSWAAPIVHITLGNDGMIEASYLATAKIGDPDNIRNRVVAYVPEHLLVLQNEHAPKNIPFSAHAFSKIRTVIELQDLGGDHTRVIESGVGYGEGKDFDSVYAHFRSGNTEEFDLLAKSLVNGPIDWKVETGAVGASIKTPTVKSGQ